MEELLASIRKAINEDIGEPPPVRREASTNGTVRESHLKLAPASVPSVANEIEELRSRISRNRMAEGLARTSVFPAPTAAPPKTPGFAGILGGNGDRFKRAPEPPPPQPVLRASFAETDTRHHDYRYERAPPREPEPVFQAPAPYPNEPSVMSAETSAAASVAFHRLADSLLSRATGDRSIEDMTRELLRSMVKQWLDDNLPGLVERLVREEIERVARRPR